jgi:hypothetical protein
MIVVNSIEEEDIRLTLSIDEYALNPREWDHNFGIMICKHNGYTLGDIQAENTELYSNWDEYFKNEILDKLGFTENDLVYGGLFLYDHSGLSISIGWPSFGDKWDCGQIGFIYCPKSKFIDELGYSEDELFGSKGIAMEILSDEVETYNNYINGSVYALTLEEVTFCPCCGSQIMKTLNSISSIYGYDEIESAKDVIDEKYYHLIDQL